MNTFPRSGGTFGRRGLILAVCATIFPLTLTGQASGATRVRGEIGVNGVDVVVPQLTSGTSWAARLLLGVVQQKLVSHGKPSRTRAVSRRADAPVAVHASGDTVSLQVYLPAAHRVTVAGDMTDWQPVDMIRQRGGWWGMTFLFSGSLSHLHMQRDDGAWQPVPGLPRTRDAYGGMVSLLVVPGPRVYRGSPPA